MEIERRISKREGDEIFFPGCEYKRVRLFRQHLLDISQSIDDYYDPSVVGDDVDEVPIDATDAFEFELEEPVYSDVIEFDKFVDVKKGCTFDVLSLLSKSCPNSGSNHLVRITNGQLDGGIVRVDTLNAKYILLCCVFIPILVDGSDSELLHSLSLLSHEMSKRDDFEMVLVLKVRPRWSHHPDVFTHFVKPFSCLAVPFDHHARIDSICRAVNMGCDPAGLLVDPNQLVIQPTLSFVCCAGMDAFPFTDAHIRFDQHLVYNRKPLEQLLGHASVFRTFSNRPEVESIADRTFSDICEMTSVANLGHKLVGLYLYITGDDMTMLHNVYRQCQTKGLEFEVVVLCIPFHEIVKPEYLDQAMATILKRMKLHWWILPFNNSVFHRLFVRSCYDISDRLFIVLPNGKLMDPHGELVTRHFGIDAYPFTRETVIKKALDKLRPLTLESSLLGGFLYRGPDRISLAHIRGKNVILCLCSGEEIKSMYKLLNKNYFHLKAKDPDLEVVFACFDTHISDLGKWFLSSMPWLVYLRDPSKSEFVSEDLSFWDVPKQKLVAFGKDGHICSLDVQYLLWKYGPSAFPFAVDLVNDIGHKLNCKVTNFTSDMVWSDRSSI